MRNVTIERKKSFVASLAKFRVFVEDAQAPDLMIQGVPCRKVGEMKNGETITFEVGEEATKLFVINGQTSQEFCAELYPLPAGNTDVYLSGACKLDPSAGNAFRFDGNDSEEAQQVRKNSKKKGVLTTIITVVLCVLFGVGFGLVKGNGIKCSKSKEKNYTAMEMDITLDSSFKKESQIGFAARFDSSDAEVFVERVSKDDMGDEFKNLTVDEFAQLVVEGGGFGYGRTLEHEGSLPYIEFSQKDSSSGETVKGFVAFYKSENAYWDVQFYSLEKDFKKMRSSFVKWAKSVSFGE
ncbi:MAG: hypothetical protein IJJ86_03445 [Clostridia bacterium]|nr:hypothetical protein [Clostridia bacterium]